jgi:hypothetical protein
VLRLRRGLTSVALGFAGGAAEDKVDPHETITHVVYQDDDAEGWRAR